MSMLQVTIIHPYSLSLLVERFSEVFCFSTSSSPFSKIHREKESVGGIRTTDPWVQMREEVALHDHSANGTPMEAKKFILRN